MDIRILKPDHVETFINLSPFDWAQLHFDLDEIKKSMSNKDEVEGAVLQYTGNPPIGKERPDKPTNG